MTNSKNFLSSFVLTFSLCFFSFFIPLSSQASGNSYGWFASVVDYIGDGTICSPGKTELDISLANYADKGSYSGTVGIWYLNVKDNNGNDVSSDMYNGQLISNPVCVDLSNSVIQVIFNETTDTHGLITTPLTPQLSNNKTDMVGYFTRDHFRGYVHLRSKERDEEDSNISSISPNNVALNNTPDFIVETNEMPIIYGPSTLKSINVYSYNVLESSYKNVSVPAFGGIATRQITGMPTLNDGPYLWFYYQTFTGENRTSKLSNGTSTNWTFNSLPSTGITSPLSFIIDTKLPETNNIVDVKTVSSVGDDQIQARVKINAQDVTSGVALSSLIVKDTVTGKFISQVDTILGQQRDLLELNFTLSLLENTSYTIIHELTDDAGNISVSESFIYLTPTVADLNAPTLDVRPATDIGSNQAFIPSYISDNGGSSVVERGTCWSLQNFDSIEVRSDITCLSEASTSTSFFIGSFGFTHLNLPASSTIYYRGFARNGNSTGLSPISTFKTSRLGIEITPSPKPPVIGALYSSSTGAADTIEITLRFDDTGGTLVNKRAICWDTSVASLPVDPVSNQNCYVDDTLLNTPYPLPHYTTHTFYGIPSGTTLYVKGYVYNLFGSTTEQLVINTPERYLDISQPDFDVASANSTDRQTYTLFFPVSAQDFSNYVPSILQPISREVPYVAKLSTLDGTVIDTITGMIDAYDYSRPPAIISHNFANISPGTYQLLIEVNSPESTYPERAASTTAGFNNLRVKLLNLPDPDGGPIAPPTRSPDIDEKFALYFDKGFSRPQLPTTLHWNTVFPFDFNCKIYGGTNFGPTAIFSFNPSIDGAQGSVKLGSVKNFQTFDLICVDSAVGTGLMYGTSTSIISTGSYSSM